jgi:hypothetical protein
LANFLNNYALPGQPVSRDNAKHAFTGTHLNLAMQQFKNVECLRAVWEGNNHDACTMIKTSTRINSTSERFLTQPNFILLEPLVRHNLIRIYNSRKSTVMTLPVLSNPVAKDGRILLELAHWKPPHLE